MSTLIETSGLSQQISNLEIKVNGALGNIEGIIRRIMQVLVGLNAAIGLGLFIV